MKTNILKIFAIAVVVTFVVGGVAMADGWKGEGGRKGHAYGHYKHGGYPHYGYCAPRPVYVERQYYPVVVERHVYPPAPSGYFFGMSVVEPGVAFSFGVSGR